MSTFWSIVLGACLVAAAVDGLLKRADDRRTRFANETDDGWEGRS